MDIKRYKNHSQKDKNEKKTIDRFITITLWCAVALLLILNIMQGLKLIGG